MSRLTCRAATLALAFVVACADERASVAPPRPAPPPMSANAWIAVSDTNAVVGSEVAISAYAKTDEPGDVGSFTARLLYDTLQLALVGADSVNDAALRAVNPIPGELRVAGAAATGIPGGLLFRMRMKVLDPRGLRRIGLLLDEMHSASLHDLTKKLTIRDSKRELLQTTPGVRVAPPSQP